ncbi:MAG: hypothetical protein EXR07_17795 [Acetobacteraceae bacterium]|nr:hypothetical protein [Acetobacteraceae bacterium]
MGFIRFPIAAAVAWAFFFPSIVARAQPAQVALVIGSATYAAGPGLPACGRSANVVAAALKAAGFDVTERVDASIGGIDSGISDFSRRLTQGPATALVYVCGYGASFNDRAFMLPVTARIARPSDVLTQGILLKSLLDTVKRDGVTASVVIFDMVPNPDPPSPLGLETLAGATISDNTGVAAIAETATSDAPTPVAVSVIAALAKRVIRSDGILANLETAMADARLKIAVLRMPAHPDYLAGAPRIADPVKPPALTPPVTAPPIAQMPPIPAPTLPDESQMTDLDRRSIQISLARLGYYSRGIDGVFGPETRSAIQRFQTRIGAETTGRLTAAQANQLIGPAR